MDLNLQIKNIIEARENSKKEKERADLELAYLMDAIKDGQTTGDQIKDFVIYCHGSLDEEKETPYREIESIINSNIGKKVLIIKGGQSYSGCTGFNNPINPMQICTHYENFLGIIESEFQINIKNKNVLIPFEKYLNSSHNGMEKDWQTKNESMILTKCDAENLNKEIDQFKDIPKDGKLYEHFQNSLEIVIGDENIEKRFSRDRDKIRYTNGLIMLGLSPKEELRQLYEDNIKQEKQGLYDKLFRLDHSIKQENKNPHVRGGLINQIQSVLNKSIQKESDELDYTFEPQTGITVNLKDYVNNLCQTYEVEIK